MGEETILLGLFLFSSRSQNPAPMGNMVNGKYRPLTPFSSELI